MNVLTYTAPRHGSYIAKSEVVSQIEQRHADKDDAELQTYVEQYHGWEPGYYDDVGSRVALLIILGDGSAGR